MRGLLYTLEGHEPIESNDALAWAMWFETADTQVALDLLETPDGTVTISTVFLGADHNFDPDGLPLLFETMVFGGHFDHHEERYPTWEAAEAGHAEMVRTARLVHA